MNILGKLDLLHPRYICSFHAGVLPIGLTDKAENKRNYTSIIAVSNHGTFLFSNNNFSNSKLPGMSLSDNIYYRNELQHLNITSVVL